MTSVFSLYKKTNVIVAFFLLGIIFFIITTISLCKLFYPVCYINEVKTYAKKYNVDSYLVLAVINTESGFDRLAVSSRGAVGLMQIMPSTAEAIAEDLEISGFSNEDLYDADTNIQLGCYYISYLSNKFDSVEKMLFAYNAGEGTLQGFLNENNGEFAIEKIQIEETKSFINRVKKAYNYYKLWHRM